MADGPLSGFTSIPDGRRTKRGRQSMDARYNLCCSIADTKGTIGIISNAKPMCCVRRHPSTKPMNSRNQECGRQTPKFNWATSMFRHRKLAQVLYGWLAAAVFFGVAIIAPGCSTQQNRATPEEQSQNLPAVGSVEDYLAQGKNDYPYMYSPYGACDPFMIEPFCYAPSWYLVPIYYFPEREPGHHHPPMNAAARIPPPAHEMNIGVAPAALNAPNGSTHFGGFGGAMRGFGAGHMGGGRR